MVPPFLAALGGPATAQTNQPRVDPGQTERRLDELLLGRKPSEAPRVRRQAAPAAKLDTRPLFKLTRGSIEGARTIPPEALREAYRPYLGKKVSQADLAAIAEAITDVYRQAGYHLTRAIVPVQDIENGRVRIRVIEGRVTDIVLVGEGHARFGIRPLLEPIVAEQPSRLATLERYLLLANDRPGVRVADAAIEEIGAASGRFRLTLNVEVWGVYSAVSLDNWGQKATGPLQSYFATAFNSAFVSGDILGLEFSTIPDQPRELAFGRLIYEAPVGNEGTRIGALASYGQIQPGDDRRALRTRETIEAFEFRESFVPVQSRAYGVKLTASAGFLNDRETDTLGTNYRDHIRTVALTADLRAHDSYGGTNFLTLGLRQGLGIFGASKAGDPLLSHSDGSGTFSKAEFQFTRYQQLSDIWSIKFAAAGQWASRALLQSQEFYIGGPAFGRAFAVGEISGDSGIAGSIELRFDQTTGWPSFKGYQLYGFVDGGTVWNVGDGGGASNSLASAGGGVRFYFAEDLKADVGVAFALNKPAGVSDRDTRVFFSVSNAFKFCPDRPNMKCL